MSSPTDRLSAALLAMAITSLAAAADPSQSARIWRSDAQEKRILKSAELNQEHHASYPQEVVGARREFWAADANGARRAGFKGDALPTKVAADLGRRDVGGLLETRSLIYAPPNDSSHSTLDVRLDGRRHGHDHDHEPGAAQKARHTTAMTNSSATPTTPAPPTISTQSSGANNSGTQYATINYNGLIGVNATDPYAITTESRSFSLPTETQILMCLLYGTLAFTAVASNMIVCYIVLSSQRMRTATNYFIVNLAVGDILMALLCIPFTFPANLIFQYWPFGFSLCVIVSYSQANSVFISAYTMVAISIDKYIAIMYPMRPRMLKRQAKMIILVIWSAALLTSLPTALLSSLTAASLELSAPTPTPSPAPAPLSSPSPAATAPLISSLTIAQENIVPAEVANPLATLERMSGSASLSLSGAAESSTALPTTKTAADTNKTSTTTTAPPVAQQTNQHDSDEQKRYFCQESWSFWPRGKYYYSMALMILQFVLPLFVLVITYSRIVIVVWGKRMPGEEDDARDARMARSKRKMIKMVIFCVIAFALTWLPFNALIVIGDMHPVIWEHQHITYIWFITHYLAMCHTITNPLIYIWMNNRFRAGFKQVIGDLCRAVQRALAFLVCYCLCLGCCFNYTRHKYSSVALHIERKRAGRAPLTSTGSTNLHIHNVTATNNNSQADLEQQSARKHHDKHRQQQQQHQQLQQQQHSQSRQVNSSSAPSGLVGRRATNSKSVTNSHVSQLELEGVGVELVKIAVRRPPRPQTSTDRRDAGCSEAESSRDSRVGAQPVESATLIGEPSTGAEQLTGLRRVPLMLSEKGLGRLWRLMHIRSQGAAHAPAHASASQRTYELEQLARASQRRGRGAADHQQEQEEQNQQQQQQQHSSLREGERAKQQPADKASTRAADLQLAAKKRRRRKRRTHAISVQMTTSEFHPNASGGLCAANSRQGANASPAQRQKCSLWVAEAEELRLKRNQSTSASRRAHAAHETGGRKFVVDLRQSSHSTATISAQTNNTSLAISPWNSTRHSVGETSRAKSANDTSASLSGSGSGEESRDPHEGYASQSVSRTELTAARAASTTAPAGVQSRIPTACLQEQLPRDLPDNDDSHTDRCEPPRKTSFGLLVAPRDNNPPTSAATNAHKSAHSEASAGKSRRARVGLELCRLAGSLTSASSLEESSQTSRRLCARHCQSASAADCHLEAMHRNRRHNHAHHRDDEDDEHDDHNDVLLYARDAAHKEWPRATSGADRPSGAMCSSAFELVSNHLLYESRLASSVAGPRTPLEHMGALSNGCSRTGSSATTSSDDNAGDNDEGDKDEDEDDDDDQHGDKDTGRHLNADLELDADAADLVAEYGQQVRVGPEKVRKLSKLDHEMGTKVARSEAKPLLVAPHKRAKTVDWTSLVLVAHDSAQASAGRPSHMRALELTAPTDSRLDRGACTASLVISTGSVEADHRGPSVGALV